jgi:S1-C subfamily serine protease
VAALVVITGGVVAVVALTGSDDEKVVARNDLAAGDRGKDNSEESAKGTNRQRRKKTTSQGHGTKKQKNSEGNREGRDTQLVKRPSPKDQGGDTKEAGPKDGDKEEATNKDRPAKEDEKEAEKSKDAGKEDPKEPAEKEKPSAPKDGRLPRAVLERVKAATVYFRVTMPSGAVAQGSGFFGIEKGLVLTNAHVLGMLEPSSRLPRKIDIVLNSGTKKERKLSGRVLGVDRMTDLALLRVDGDDLPAPLRVKSARQLNETERVFVVGFPLGVDLGKNVSFRKSSVSALRQDEFGTLKKVQLEGGMDPGNSGGPVVDARGNVVGVAVSKIVATQINFAVPGDFVRVILNGRVTATTTGFTYKDGDKVKSELTAEFLDPLDRVKKVYMVYWTGDPGKSRPASVKEPKPQPGDSAYRKLPMDYRKGHAMATWELPPRQKGKVYWKRVVYVNGAGETKWVAAIPYDPPPPVERKPALLSLKHTLATRPLRLTSAARLRLVAPGGEEHTLGINLQTDFIEQTQTVDARGSAGIFLRYRVFKLGVCLDNKPPADRADLQPLVNTCARMAARLAVASNGDILRQIPDARAVPPRAREDVLDLHDQVQASLKAITVILPGREVKAGESWTAVRPLVLFTEGKGELGAMVVTYTYLGSRTRNGREEALIRISGAVRGRKGRELTVGGKADGFALLDLASGQISLAKVVVNIDLDLKFGKRSAQANGTLQVVLHRGVVPAKKQ